MRSYSSTIYRSGARSSPWRWFFIGLALGFVAGFIVAYMIHARAPIELVVSGSSQSLPPPGEGVEIPAEGTASTDATLPVEHSADQISTSPAE